MTTAPPCRWHRFASWAALLLLTGVALAVRSPGLGLDVISSDESFSWRLAQYPPSELIRRTGTDVHPPLSYLLLKAWVAVWGSSLTALRGFSLLFGVLCVPLLYAVCREAWQLRSHRDTGPRPPAWSAALLAALLGAIHATEVVPSRNARMYALGAFLAGLTAWLLLRALRSLRWRGAWWASYGVAVAVFCYTHYYAFFTVLAQAVFVVGLATHEWRAGRSHQATGLVGRLLSALAIALLLYLPWLDVLRGQVQQVQRGYWLIPITTHAAEAHFFSWATGVPYQGGLESHLVLLLLMVAVVATLWKGDRIGWFFLLQWALPWALSLGISVLTGRTIFLERYMAFAHFSFLAYVATIVCWGLHERRERTLVACALVMCCLYGLWHVVLRFPGEPPAMAAAIRYLKSHLQPGDLVVTDSAYLLNRVRYYDAQEGIASMNVRCRVNWASDQSHFSHVASISAEDLWWDEHQAGHDTSRRIWWATESGNSHLAFKEGFHMATQQTFEDSGCHLAITLCDRSVK